jgi:hypothetical protein
LLSQSKFAISLSLHFILTNKSLFLQLLAWIMTDLSDAPWTPSPGTVDGTKSSKKSSRRTRILFVSRRWTISNSYRRYCGHRTTKASSSPNPTLRACTSTATMGQTGAQYSTEKTDSKWWISSPKFSKCGVYKAIRCVERRSIIFF